MAQKTASANGHTRREFLRTAAGAAAGVAIAGAGFPSFLRAGQQSRPNIILFVADDLGRTDMGCFGDRNYKSPNLDRMAAEGVRFTNAFVTASSCSPSRATLMTGQAPHSVGVLGLTHVHPQYQMSSKIPTTAEALRRKGYATAIAGKWHVAPYKPVKHFGYDEQLTVGEITNTAAIRDFIKRRRDTPFFMELNFFQTHRPNVTPEYQQQTDFPIDPDKISAPEYWRLPDWPEIRRDMAGYYSQAAWQDALIGEIWDQVEREGLDQRTLMIFVSDNGPNFPGIKATCYDRGTGTPLIMRWPEGLPRGKAIDQLISTIDIAPTCLAAAGLKSISVMQGQSLLPLAKGEIESEIHEAIFSEITYHVIHTPMRAIRTRGYKYIHNLSSAPVDLDLCDAFEWAHRVAQLPGQRCCVPRPPEELYDLSADPHEENNLAADPRSQNIKSELRKQLDAWRSHTNDPVK